MSSTQSILITGGHGFLAQSINQHFSQLGHQVHAPSKHELNVTSKEQTQSYIKQLDNLDLCIINAGVTIDKILHKQDSQSWDHSYQVNLKGAFLSAQSCLRKLLKSEHGGHIIFLSSYSAIHPPLGQANYSAHKAALLGLSKSIAKEYGNKGLRSNCVFPGFIPSPLTKHLSPEREQSILEQHQLKQFNTAHNAAKFIAHLHLEQPYISGQTFQLDSRQS